MLSRPHCTIVHVYTIRKGASITFGCCCSFLSVWALLDPWERENYSRSGSLCLCIMTLPSALSAASPCDFEQPLSGWSAVCGGMFVRETESLSTSKPQRMPGAIWPAQKLTSLRVLMMMIVWQYKTFSAMMSHCLIQAFAEHEKKIFFLLYKKRKRVLFIVFIPFPPTHCWSAHRAEEKMFLRTLLCQSAGWNHFHKRRHAVCRARNTRGANNFIIADTPRPETPHRTDEKSRQWCHIWTAPINRTIEYIQIAQSFVDSAVVWQSNRHSKFSLRCRFFLMRSPALLLWPIKPPFSTRFSKLDSRLFYFPIKHWQQRKQFSAFFRTNWIRNGAIIAERNKNVAHMY